MSEVLDKQLREILCCPACRGDLEYAPAADELSCRTCRHTYPIIDGIPVLFPTDVKSRFEELFGRFWDSPERAAVYDRFVEGRESMMGRHHHEGETRATLEVLGPLASERLLDCGCGNGRFFEHYPERVFSVGIDASLNLLRICRARGRCARLVCGQLESLPFRSGSFDRSVSVRVLQHLREQRRAVEEMVRVLDPGGAVVLHCYNDWSSKAWTKRVRMSPRWQPIANAPFRALHRSLSPFAPWGLDYDAYSNVPQLQRWLAQTGARVTTVRGSGFGFNKWLVDGFLIAPRLERDQPQLLRRYLAASLWLEEALGRRAPFSYVMEKFVLRAEKVPV